MTCSYDELANKLEVHQKVNGSPGFHLSELEIQTIIEALRFAGHITSHGQALKPHPQELD